MSRPASIDWDHPHRHSPSPPARMNGSITLPTWQFAALVLLCLLDRLMVPSARWFIRQRTLRVLEEVNRKLPIEIQPFRMARRQVLVDRLMSDPRVVQAVAEYANEHRVPLDMATSRAER